MLLDAVAEGRLKEEVLPLLERGKEGWDVPHTFLCVERMRELIAKEGGNERILVPAMYLHDIGYPYLKGGGTFGSMLDGKKVHEEIGALESEKILRRIGGFSNAEIVEIVDLVRWHDHLEKLDGSLHRQLVMEADSLAQVDWHRITPTFSKEDSLAFLEYFKKNRLEKFKTATGKKLLSKLLKEAENYWK